MKEIIASILLTIGMWGGYAPAEEPTFGATVLFPYQGGTGVSDVPGNGQILIGDGSGAYIVDDFSTYDTGGAGGSGYAEFTSVGDNQQNVSTTPFLFANGLMASSSPILFEAATSTELTVTNSLFVGGSIFTNTGLDYWDNKFNSTTTWAHFTTNFNTLFNATSTFGGNSQTATALAANGGNCAAGSYPLGVDTLGASESCTDATTEIDSAISTHAAINNAHQALVTLAGTPDYLTLSGQEITRNAIDLTTDITGNLPVTNLNSGTSASASTFWRGDATWATPAGGAADGHFAQATTTDIIGTSLFSTSGDTWVTPTGTVALYLPSDLYTDGDATTTGQLTLSGDIVLDNDSNFVGRDTAGTEARLLTANSSNDAHFLANVGNGNILDSAYGFFNSDVPVILGDACCGGNLPTSLAFNTSGDINFNSGKLFVDTSESAIGINDTSATEATLVVGSAGAGDIYATFTDLSSSATLCWDGTGASLIEDCTSLLKYKTNIVDLSLGLDTIMQLQPRAFNWINDGRSDLGFIAEEVEAVNPLLASYVKKDIRKDMTDDELLAYNSLGGVEADYLQLGADMGLEKKVSTNGTVETDQELADRVKADLVTSLRSDNDGEILSDWTLSGVKYRHLTALLVKGIQEQQAEIDSLETRLIALETAKLGGEMIKPAESIEEEGFSLWNWLANLLK